MNENYIVINGKKAELTAKQLKTLGVEVETKRKNPFARVVKSKVYYPPDFDVSALKMCEWNNMFDDKIGESCYKSANRFNDESFAKQVALYQLLYRKLLKFAYDNECEDTAEWDGCNRHWMIAYNTERNDFVPDWKIIYKTQEVYFSSSDGARDAIHEVVKPFMIEHPDFVW